MGHTHSRRGASAAPAGPPRKRRTSQPARAARAFPGETVPAFAGHSRLRPATAGSPSGDPTKQNRPAPGPRLVHHRRTPDVPPRAPPVGPPVFSSFASLLRHAAATPVAGPSLRVDIPRPPLRGLLLHALRRRRQMTAAAVAALDAHWQAARRLTRQQIAATQGALRSAAERARASAAPLDPSPSASLVPHTAAAFVAAPSLRQDVPRPPLRALMLRGLRRQRQMTATAVTVLDVGRQAAQQRTQQQLNATSILIRRAADRAYARVARTAAHAIAHLDAHVFQPALWPFRPAQREMLAGTLASLSVAVVASGWIVAYNTLAPTPAARPAPPPAPKQITERVVSHALPVVEIHKVGTPVEAVPMIALPTVDGTTIEVPLPVPPPHFNRRPAPLPRLL